MNNITLRDYFAAHAPTEIPEWFDVQHRAKRPAFTGTPKPDIKSLHPDDRGMALEWMRDPCWDLSLEGNVEDKVRYEAFILFQAQYEKHCDDMRKYETSEKVNRYFWWRWAYAEMMISSKGGDCQHE